MGRLWMGRLWIGIFVGIVGAGSLLAAGQATPPANVVSDASISTPSAGASNSAPDSATPSIEVLRTETETTTPLIEIVKAVPVTPEAAEAADVLIDPASLLPDLPKVPVAQASLIGGTIGRLDRVRDEITVQVFGGGKIKISFDPRTHIYHDGAEASLADLRQGDRVYIETILDGGNVFARAIRLKTSTSAGESQGIVTSYRAEKGELELRDALSPRVVKIRVNSQTRIMEGDHTASSGRLASGTLVAVKFGPRQDGSEVAREISVLAAPGDSFTFAGQITAIDLRLGLIVLISSTDHKTYEIYLDPAVGLDDRIRPATDVTVLTRFLGNRYVARSISVNSQNRQ